MQNNIFPGLFVGQNIITLNEVASTNTYLKDALSKSTPFLEGTVIMAEKQYEGRGQTNNIWQSEAGKNLTFSILLNPSFLPVDKQFELNKAISLALNDVLTRYFGNPAKIKWPNDLYINGEKIGGILIENIIQGNTIKHAIIGIGLNVNQAQFLPDIKHATSFKKILHNDYDLQIVLADICKAVEARYLRLKAGKTDEITTGYMQKLYLRDEWAIFKISAGLHSGKITGINAEGRLLVEIKNKIQPFDFKEIEFIHSI